MNLATITTSELLVILDITRRLAEQRLVGPLMEYVAGTVFEIISAQRCMIVLFDDDGAPAVQVARDRQGQSLGTAPDQMSRSILERVRLTLTPLHIGDALADKALKEIQSVRTLGLRSVICVPLVSYGQAIGAIYVENRSARNQFGEDNLVPLILFSHQVVVALENARLYESLEARIEERTRALREANVLLAQQAVELREQSIRDSLTGLFNRRYFNEHLPHMFELARRYGRPLSLACIDIDNFKQVNDSILHAGGDRVLVEIAGLLCGNTRDADRVVRLGGEEFAVLMPDTPLSTALLACERLRTMIECHDWDAIAPGLRVTVSIGVADNNGCAGPQDLLAHADIHLYAAKGQGKNRVAGGG